MLTTVHLNGADPDHIAAKTGGTVIMVNISDDTAMLSGADISKLIHTSKGDDCTECDALAYVK